MPEIFMRCSSVKRCRNLARGFRYGFRRSPGNERDEPTIRRANAVRKSIRAERVANRPGFALVPSASLKKATCG